MRVFYVCNWVGPSGGIKVLYDHVRLLRRNGFDAYLAAYDRFHRCIWFEHAPADIPGVDRLICRVLPDDLIVVPEIALADREILGCPGRKIAFVQNASLIPQRADLGAFEFLMVPSGPLGEQLRGPWGWRDRIEVVPGFLEAELVAPSRSWSGGPLRALVIPRKDKHRGEPYAAIAALRALGVAVTVVTRLIDRHAFARLFRSHPLYLHLSYPEGFPTPVMEAFGAGCLVIGFAGIGGLEFMRSDDNCLIVADGDWRAAVRQVLRVRNSRSGDLDPLLAGARSTALAYTEDRMACRLDEVFTAALAVHGRAAVRTP